ncbi:endonuclease/exonuclease/phosphatase family protein, partial [Vibrio vulnificus]|uniref:endonuclease/exonuclease/phosphatase family protein n=1 Tax=Vibrio vulnificus TaxID=672 RepID=UPI0039C96939
MGVYAPPSMSHPDFLHLLWEMGGGIRRCLPHPVLVAGDFNAWHTDWGSRCNGRRGECVKDWAAEL